MSANSKSRASICTWSPQAFVASPPCASSALPISRICFGNKSPLAGLVLISKPPGGSDPSRTMEPFHFWTATLTWFPSPDLATSISTARCRVEGLLVCSVGAAVQKVRGFVKKPTVRQVHIRL
jgi:hypothetical protein